MFGNVFHNEIAKKQSKFGDGKLSTLVVKPHIVTTQMSGYSTHKHAVTTDECSKGCLLEIGKH